MHQTCAPDARENNKNCYELNQRPPKPQENPIAKVLKVLNVEKEKVVYMLKFQAKL